MANSITIATFEERLAKLAERIKVDFPNVNASISDRQLWLRTVTCSGLVTLRLSNMADSMCVSCEFSRGAALNGSMSEVDLGIRDYQRVYAALEIAVTEFEGLYVTL